MELTEFSNGICDFKKLTPIDNNRSDEYIILMIMLVALLNKGEKTWQ